MNFSVVFPTRERPELLLNLLNSIKVNTFDPENIEVLIAIDEDDTSYNHIDWEPYHHFVRVFRVKRSLNFSRDYYTFLAQQSTGRWIIACNDDCQFETRAWDEIAFQALKDAPGVVHGWIQDGLDGYRAPGHGNYCCFPLQGRAGFEALGYIFPSRIPTWGADIWLKSLYDQVDSVVEVPIVIKHYCHHNKTREQDAISKRIQNNQVPFDMKPTYEEVNLLLEVLRKEVVGA